MGNAYYKDAVDVAYSIFYTSDEMFKERCDAARYMVKGKCEIVEFVTNTIDDLIMKSDTASINQAITHMSFTEKELQRLPEVVRCSCIPIGSDTTEQISKLNLLRDELLIIVEDTRKSCTRLNTIKTMLEKRNQVV